MAPILNTAQFKDLVCGDYNTFSLIIDEYEATSLTLIQTIKDTSENNLDASKDALHQLKGSSGMLGFTALFELCQEYEMQLKSSITIQQTTPLETLFFESVKCARKALS